MTRSHADRYMSVVYLHRHGNDPSALATFLSSYRAHGAGVAHELVILVKGFPQDRLPMHDDDLLTDVPARRLPVPDIGFDIGSYRDAARQLQHDRLCFLNSHSEIRADDWLVKLAAALDVAGVGAAGASGSWLSTRTSYLPSSRRGPWAWPRGVAGRARAIVTYPTFPNAHLRPNAFVMDRTDFLDLDVPRLRRKFDCYRFESGRHSLTRQLAGRGLRAVVVDDQGRSWGEEEWAESSTFWRSDQEHLLVADNQTRMYDSLSSGGRKLLTDAAWAGGPVPSPETLRKEMTNAAGAGGVHRRC